MRVEISNKPLVERVVLERVGNERLAEAKALYEAEKWAGTVYLAGYAVECWLKVAICARLGWTHLYPTFKVHDLEVLLLHCGLENDLQKESNVTDSFKRIVGLWKHEGPDNIRYKDPQRLTAQDAEDFLDWVNDPQSGVVPWVKARI